MNYLRGDAQGLLQGLRRAADTHAAQQILLKRSPLLQRSQAGNAVCNLIDFYIGEQRVERLPFHFRIRF